MRPTTLFLLLPLLCGWHTAASAEGRSGVAEPATILALSGQSTAGTSTKVYRCSQIGCPTDGVTKIDSIVQPLLARASASNPVVLELDGPLFVTCGLYISEAGYTEIRGLGMGATRLKIVSHCNQHVIRVGAAANVQTDTGVILPQTAGQIFIHDLTLDGNRGTGYSYPAGKGTTVGNGNSTSADQRGQVAGENGETRPSRWLFDLDISNAHDVTVSSVSFEAAPTYSFRATNTTNIWVTHNRFSPFGPDSVVIDTNTDGMHFSGYTKNAWIDDNYCRTGDDCIALNAPEGSGGTIQNVHLSNLTLDDAQTGVRIYAVAASRQAGTIEDLDINGVTGTANVIGFIIGLENQHPQTYPDVIRNVTIRNVRLAVPHFMLLNDSIGSTQISNAVWVVGRHVGGMIEAWMNNMTWSGISLSNCGMVRNPDGRSATAIVDSVSMFTGTQLSIQQLNVSNFTVQDLDAAGKPTAYGKIPVLNASIGTTVNSMNTDGLSASVDNVLNVDGKRASAQQFASVLPAVTLTTTELRRLATPPTASAALGGGGMYGMPYASGISPSPVPSNAGSQNPSNRTSGDTTSTVPAANTAYSSATPAVNNSGAGVPASFPMAANGAAVVPSPRNASERTAAQSDVASTVAMPAVTSSAAAANAHAPVALAGSTGVNGKVQAVSSGDRGGSSVANSGGSGGRGTGSPVGSARVTRSQRHHGRRKIPAAVETARPVARSSHLPASQKAGTPHMQQTQRPCCDVLHARADVL